MSENVSEAVIHMYTHTHLTVHTSLYQAPSLSAFSQYHHQKRKPFGLNKYEVMGRRKRRRRRQVVFDIHTGRQS